MGVGRGLLTAVVVLFFSILYGCMSLFGLLLKFVTNPSHKFWRVKRREVPPECLKNPILGQHGYIAGAKGVKIHYVEKGDRSKPLMLMVHGFPEFWYSWRWQIEEFSSEYWVVAIDLRGYGDSDKPKGVSSYNIDLLVEDIKCVVEGLGRKNFYLVAHDWGAGIAWEFLRWYPEMIERYIVMNGPHKGVLLKHVTSNLGQFLKSWYMLLFQIPYLPEIWLRSDDMIAFEKILRPSSKNKIKTEDIEAFKYTFGKPGAFTAPINYYRAAIQSLVKRELFGNDSKKPAPKSNEEPRGLLVFGDKDDFLGVELVEMTQKKFKRLERAIISGANHFVQQDDPVAVNKAMWTFLKN